MVKVLKNFNFGVLLGALLFISTSCANKDKQEQALSGNLIIRSARFIADGQINRINEAENRTGEKLASISKSTPAPLLIHGGKDFDFTTTVQSNASAAQTNGLKAASATSPLRAADVPLNNSIKFRLVFMKDGNSTPIYNEVLTADQDPNLRIAVNTAYHWYAISVNDQSTAPDIDGSGSIQGADLANKDFMFASGAITGQEGENYLDILFLRQMAAIELSLNTRGLFGGLTDNSVLSIGQGTGGSFSNIVQTGDFNIFNGTFANLRDADPLRGDQMQIVDNRWGNAEKIGRFFTASNTTIPANNLCVKLNALQITLDDNTTRTFAANTIVPIAHSNALNLTKGTLSSTSIRLIESGININGLIWARTNLIYDVNKLYGGSYSAGNSDAYRFRPNNNYAYANVNTEYWNFGTTVPSGTDYGSVDECRRVYPEGTWRLPQELNNPKEMTQLSQNTNRTVSMLQVADGYRYSIAWFSSQPANSAYPDNNLVLSFYGYRDANGNIQEIPSGSSNGTGTIQYRSNQFNTANNNNYVLYAQVNNGTYGNTSIIQTAPSLGTVIRCVRNVVNN